MRSTSYDIRSQERWQYDGELQLVNRRIVSVLDLK